MKIKNSINPYGNGGASKKLLKFEKKNKKLNNKKFYDIKF